MNINEISYDPYLYTGIKAISNSINTDNEKIFSTQFENNMNTDSIEVSSQLTSNNQVNVSELKKDIEKTKSEQGFIGKLWDGFKNLTGIGAGSNKAEKAIEQFENGEISQEEMEKAVNGYKEGQKQCVDIVADIVSGIASFGAFALATGVGIAASPFTGGASLGLVAAGFGIAGAAGAASKIAIKGIDAAVGGRDYDSLGYDLATGGVNGIFAPITAGVGGAAGKAVAGKVGVTAIREGGEVVLRETLEGTAKGALTRTLLTTNIKYTGGTLASRALAMGTDMAINGALSGAVDSGTRYLAGDSENKSIEGFMSEVGTGTVSGFVLSPIIGGGMRILGNGVGKFTGKLQNKVDVNYSTAKSAMMNVPVVENPDTEVLRGLGEVINQAQSFVEDVHVNGSDLLDGLEENLFQINDNITAILRNTSALNNDLNALSQENRALIVEILEDIAQGADPSSKIAQLAQKGISMTDIVNDKIGTLSAELEEGLLAIVNEKNNLTQITTNGINYTQEVLDNGIRIANEAIEQGKKIPGTNAYKQLGDLPDRLKALYSKLKADATTLDNAAEAARTKILSGNIEEGLEDFTKYYNEVEAFNAKLEQQLTSMQSSAARSGLDESTEILRERLSKLTSSETFKNMPREKQIQAIMEESNILISKFAQTFSSDDSLPPDVLEILKQFTSKGITSRDIPQAQALADELYGTGKYTIKKSFGAGTIGETYLAETADGTEVVIKMLKDGVTSEKFAQDRAMFTRYIEEFISDPTEKEYKLNLINSMFDAWDRELDFKIEAQSARGLAEDASRFSVAQTLEVGTLNGRNISMIQEKASGVPLDGLLKMIELYKENPTEYFAKYAKEIEANPALKTPETWMGDLGIAYQKAQNEQAMFVGKSGTRTIHADPHPGNVFVDFDATTGKPKIVYIDAGNVVQRTNSQTLQDIGLSLNMMIGNSKGIAEAMLDGATLPSGADKVQLTEQFAQLLDERLYKAGVNLKSTQYTQNTINGIMKELNIIPNSSNSNLMKATLQRIETSRAINRACGTSASKAVDIKDLMNGILKSFKVNPKETWQTIKPIMQWAYQNNDQAMITFFQMIIKNAGIQTSTAVA